MRKRSLLFVLLLALLPFVGWAQQKNYYGQHVSIKRTTGDSIQYDISLSRVKPIVKNGEVKWQFLGDERVNPNDDFWSIRENFTLDNVESIDFRSFEYDERETRKALIEFYNVMDGDTWKRNDNWCTDKPIWEWYGINNCLDGCTAERYPWVQSLWFGCTLENIPTPHKIPDCLQRMGPIRSMCIPYGLEGELPEFLGNIYSLGCLDFSYNEKLSGTIPLSIAKPVILPKL